MIKESKTHAEERGLILIKMIYLRKIRRFFTILWRVDDKVEVLDCWVLVKNGIIKMEYVIDWSSFLISKTCIKV